MSSVLVTQPVPDTAREVASHFEAIYAGAGRDRSQIPWSDGRPHQALVNWLNAVAPSLVRCGGRVAVVGCGLGEDAQELIKRGYDVTAFDSSPTSVAWARELYPQDAHCYYTADVFDPPGRWRHRFDLVVEINTIQSMPPEMHVRTLGAIGDLMCPHGHLLVICRCATEPVSINDGPPWAITRSEFDAAIAESGLEPADEICVFLDDKTPPVRRMRALLQRV
jgi:SAM-dependent methyltransferase